MTTQSRSLVATTSAFAFGGIVAAALLLMTAPAFAYAATLTRSLDVGMSGSDVGSLQTFLAQDATIYPQGIVSNYYGFLTKSAVSNWQSANGIDSVGRVGPVTLAALNNAMDGGVSSNGDIYAPIISFSSANAARNTASVQWSANENATGRVMYGTSWPFLYATAPSVASNMGTSASVSLSGLSSNTKYYYTIESTDASGNVQQYIGNSFTTSN